MLAERPLGEAIELPYDYLVLAAGVEQSCFGHDEFAALAPGMKTIADALTIRRRVYGALEMAETPATGPQAPAPRAEPGERPVTGHRPAKGP